MIDNRLSDYLDHIQQAARKACGFVEGMSKDDFFKDKRTQNAVIMSIVIIGEAATKVLGDYDKFAQTHYEIPWRGMRNRIAHGYFDIKLRYGVGYRANGTTRTAEATARRVSGCRIGE